MTPPVVLTIAGSDSGGGAGIQADLRTLAALGVHGCTAVTAVTAQNSAEVRDIHVVPAAMVDAQIGAVIDDLAPAAVKTGMLATRATVDVVARRAGAGELPNLVVDPVLVSSTGQRLFDQGAERAYVDVLFPLAIVVTPNLREAEVLLGRPVSTVDEMVAAAAALARAGSDAVVVTGGHLAGGEAVDVVWHAGETWNLTAPRVDTANTHGSGCSFASAIAAGLARGASVPEAVSAAKAFVHRAISGAAGWRLGAGHGPLDHFNWEVRQT